MRREITRNAKKKDENSNLKTGLQMCMTSKWNSQCRPACDNLHVYAKVLNYLFRNFVIEFMVKVVIIIVSFGNVTEASSVLWV